MGKADVDVKTEGVWLLLFRNCFRLLIFV